MHQYNHLPQPKALGYILKGYPRISETFISNEILLLEQLGFTMHLFPMRQPRENFCHESVKQIKAKVSYLPTELLDDFTRLLVPNILLCAKYPGRYQKALRMAATGGSSNKLATLKHLLQAGFMSYHHLIHNSSIVHLHGHFAHSPTSVTRFASALSGLPYSFTAHAKDIYTSKRSKLRTRIAEAEFVVTCTKHNAQYLNEVQGDIKTPIHCIYHGIDLTLFQNGAIPHKKLADHQIFTVARLTAKKGLPTIYKALQILKNRGVTFQHTLIGDGDDREKILAMIKDLDLTEECTWLGTQTHEEVLKRFKTSDLFVLGCEIAENGDRDGIPNVLVESLAMGVPAVSTHVSAIPEILINNRTGLTVPSKNPEAMADAMERILQDRALQQSLSAEGMQYVQNGFDNKVWIEKLAEVYRSHIPQLAHP